MKGRGVGFEVWSWIVFVAVILFVSIQLLNPEVPWVVNIFLSAGGAWFLVAVVGGEIQERRQRRESRDEMLRAEGAADERRRLKEQQEQNPQKTTEVVDKDPNLPADEAPRGDRLEHFSCRDSRTVYLAPFDAGTRAHMQYLSVIEMKCPLCGGRGYHEYMSRSREAHPFAEELIGEYERTLTHNCENCGAKVSVSESQDACVATAGCPSCGKGPVSRLP